MFHEESQGGREITTNGFLSENQVEELVEALNRHSEALKNLAGALDFHTDALEYYARKVDDENGDFE